MEHNREHPLPWPEDDVRKLCDHVRQHAFALYSYLGYGHLERVYQNGLMNRLSKAGFLVEAQRRLLVRDEDGSILGEYIADMVVEDTLIIELKACKGLGDESVAQILGYLRAAHWRHGLLINFGSCRFEIRKFIW